MQSILYSKSYAAALKQLHQAQRLLRRQQRLHLPEGAHARAVYQAHLAVMAAIDAHTAACVAANLGIGLKAGGGE